MYHVWRRNDDGYVAASNSKMDWNRNNRNLTLIQSFDEWPPARDLIEQLRDTPEHRALIESWHRTEGMVRA